MPWLHCLMAVQVVREMLGGVRVWAGAMVVEMAYAYCYTSGWLLPTRSDMLR